MKKTDFNNLINKAKASNSTKTIQKITPVSSKTTDETQFSFYIEKELLKKLKLKALNEDESIKNTITRAIKNYLETN
jgi:predicted HicB family RNase H-like nuclease